MKKKILAQAQRFNNPNAVNGLEYTERNNELYKDFKNGMQLFDLAAKYRITTNRLYMIIKKMQAKEAAK
jgi:Mor family transcriptional regulator